MQTICYADGYNLYYGCLKHSNDKWLDLCKLLHHHIIRVQNPASELVSIKFFTADIRARIATHGQHAQIAQQNYHRALERCYPGQIEIIKGYYDLRKANLLAYREPPDKQERVEVWKLEEKQTDVNIAIHAYRDVMMGRAEQIVFVSNDSDLEPALSAIRQDKGGSVTIGVILPIRKPDDFDARQTRQRPRSESLSRHADWTRTHITSAELAASHLPLMVPTKKKPIRKPDYW